MKLKYKVAAAIGALSLLVTTGVAYSNLAKPDYIVSTNTAVEIKPLTYAGDVLNGVVVRGIPDGMGAYDNGNGGISLLSVHEIPSYSPIAQQSKSSTSPWGVSITKFNVTKKLQSYNFSS